MYYHRIVNMITVPRNVASYKSGMNDDNSEDRKLGRGSRRFFLIIVVRFCHEPVAREIAQPLNVFDSSKVPS